MAFISITFKSEDIQHFANKLTTLYKDVESGLVPEFGYLLDVLMVGTPIDYGTLFLGWGMDRVEGGVSFGNDVYYADILEEGKYKSVSKTSGKTVKTARGIFSTQAPDGMINPIIEHPDKFRIDQHLDKLMGNVLKQIGVTG